MSKKKTLTVADLVKDRSKGARTIAKHPAEALGHFDRDGLEQLAKAFEEYEPKTGGGKLVRIDARRAIDARLKGLAQPDSWSEESDGDAADAAMAAAEAWQAKKTDDVGDMVDAMLEAPPKEKRKGARELSGEAKAQMIKSSTECFFIKVAQPAFTACIDAEEWANKDRIQAGAVVPDPEGQADLVVDPDAVDPAAELDKKRHFVVQKLYGKEFLRPLNSNRLEFFSWVKRHAVPARLMAPHHYLVPNGLSNDVIGRIQQLIEDRNKLLDAFEGRYKEAKDDAKKRLGIHYDAARYPAFVDVRAKFTVDYRIRSLDPAASLKEINKAEWDRQTAFAKQDYENTFEIVRVGIREGFVDLIGTFADALGKDEAGKPKVFHGSKVEKLKDFLATFEARDLTKDGELSALAAKAKALLSDVDPKGIRKDMDAREALKGAFAEIGAQASKLVVVRGRKLDLDDED